MKDDLDKYINRRKRADKKFASNFEGGYQEFKVGALLRQARERAGITQEVLAQRTKTRKSAISRLENHAQDMRLSTIKRVARALGKNLVIQLVENGDGK
jgi:HTH-type transcriptional regulator/antitoxin HipB